MELLPLCHAADVASHNHSDHHHRHDSLLSSFWRGLPAYGRWASSWHHNDCLLHLATCIYALPYGLCRALVYGAVADDTVSGADSKEISGLGARTLLASVHPEQSHAEESAAMSNAIAHSQQPTWLPLSL